MSLSELLEALSSLKADGVAPETEVLFQACNGVWTKATRVEYRATHDVVVVVKEGK